MAEQRKPMTTFLVGTTAVTLLLVMVGTWAQRAAFESEASPPPYSPRPGGIEGCESDLTLRFHFPRPSPPSPAPPELKIDLAVAALPSPPRAVSDYVDGRARHVAAIGPDGRVLEAWAMAGTDPEVGKVVARALEKETLEPARVAGRAVAVCRVVAANIRWLPRSGD